MVPGPEDVEVKVATLPLKLLVKDALQGVPVPLIVIESQLVQKMGVGTPI
jgi:hypothetical protein